MDKREIFSKNLLDDLNLAKKYFNELCLKSNKKDHLIGFLQDIYQEPFGFLLISDIQVLVSISIILRIL
jgi:hypothetical protein